MSNCLNRDSPDLGIFRIYPILSIIIISKITVQTKMTMQQKSILFITTADTDILTADRALSALPAGFPRVDAVNPSNRPHPEGEGT